MKFVDIADLEGEYGAECSQEILAGIHPEGLCAVCSQHLREGPVRVETVGWARPAGAPPSAPDVVSFVPCHIGCVTDKAELQSAAESATYHTVGFLTYVERPSPQGRHPQWVPGILICPSVDNQMAFRTPGQDIWHPSITRYHDRGFATRRSVFIPDIGLPELPADNSVKFKAPDTLVMKIESPGGASINVPVDDAVMAGIAQAGGFILAITHRLTPTQLKTRYAEGGDILSVLQPETSRALAWVPGHRIDNP